MTATGPAVMEVDSRAARAAIERDLSRYSDQLYRLQQVEVEAPYGLVDPERAEIQELRRNGTCIRDVSLYRREHCIEAKWDGRLWAANPQGR